MAEQLICNQQVGGSSPFTGSTFSRWLREIVTNMGRFPSGQREQTVNLPSQTSVVRIHPCPPSSPSSAGRQHLREWRNWQTRMIQVHVFLRTCRFKSCFPHQQQIIRTTCSSSEKGSDYLFFSQKKRSGRSHPGEGENNKKRDAIIVLASRFVYCDCYSDATQR